MPIVLLLGVTLAAASPAARMLRQGMPRRAIMEASKVLAADPDDADAMAQLAAGWAATGHHADAAAAFALATGSAWYDRQGVVRHGDALRPTAPRAAAALHTAHLRMGDLSTPMEIRLYIDIIDDHRVAGDALAALDMASEALARWPRSSAILAARADVHMDLGELDAAGADLWLSAREGRVLRTHLAEGRLALLEGRPTDAFDTAQRAARGRAPALSVSVLEAEALRRLGQPGEAAALLSDRPMRTTDAPEVHAVRIRVARDLGDTAEAQSVAARARALHPGHPAVRPLLDSTGLPD